MVDTCDKKCVKFQHLAFDFLNLTYNPQTRRVVLWNKYQIFIYKKLTYECLKKNCNWIYNSEFIIVKVILSGHHIACLDECGTLHVSPLNWKLKNIPRLFTKREKNVLGISYNEDMEHSLFVLQENKNGLEFSVHKLVNELPLPTKVKLMHKNIENMTNRTSYGKILFRTYPLTEKQFHRMKNNFEQENELYTHQIFIVISFDNLTLYVTLINPEMTEHVQSVPLYKLYTCLSLLNDINFVHRGDLHIDIGLASGTLINIPLCKDLSVYNITHLNKAIAKFISYNETLIYTDGISVWKLKQIHDTDERTLTEFIVKYAKDFVVVQHRLVCLTYSKLIYFLPLDQELCYADAIITNDYCPPEHVGTSNECMNALANKIKMCKTIYELVQREKIYITAITLSNRKDIAKDLIDYKVTVYDKYEDILKENIRFSITENIAEYFHTHTIFFLIAIRKLIMPENKLSDVISNLLGNVQIHITFLFKKKVLKTTSLKVNDNLKQLFIVIPLKTHELNLTDLTVNFNIVSPVPGAFNERETLWANLHHNTVIIKPEQFICSNYGTSENIVGHLKEAKKPIKQLILETARNHHKHLFNINLLPKTDEISWYFYVKLPENYQTAFANCEKYLENLNKIKLKYIFKEINARAFQTGQATLCWWVGNEKVYLVITKMSDEIDGSSRATLKVTSYNAHVALSIRNFFSDLVYRIVQTFVRVNLDNDIMEFLEFQEKSFRICSEGNVTAKDFVRFYHRYQDTITRHAVL